MGHPSDFLNSLFHGTQVIKDLTYSKNEHLGRLEIDRKAIFDLYCENEKGEKFIVEIQKTKQKFFKDRSIYYSTFPITQQAEQGECHSVLLRKEYHCSAQYNYSYPFAWWNFELKAVYTVAILDFTFDDEDHDKTVVSQVKLMDTTKKKVFFDKLTFIYLQMPNFNMTEEELEDHFDKWLFVFKNLHRLHDRPKKLQERVFEKLFKIAEIAKFEPEEVEKYEESFKVYRDLKNSIDTAREEGKLEGKAEGKIERNFEVAETMLKNGEDDQKVALYTGLSLEDIQALRKKLNL